MYPRNHLTMLLHQLRNARHELSLSEFGRLCKQRHLDERLRLLARLYTSRFQFVIAQRFRQTIQILHLYQKIWLTRDLKQLVRTWNYRRYLFNRGQFVIASTLVTSYNWDKERISDREMYSYCNDINEVYKLKDATVVCPECRLRIVIDVVRPDVTYCKCKTISHNSSCETQEWEPFIERQDMIVWRRVEEDSGGLYAYKVYGSFDDVTAEDFLQVQIDIDYRKEWDHTAKELTVIETDPESSFGQKGTCDILYWEMIWPALFANRDYVYQRRWMLDEEKGTIVIISKATDHPDAPPRSSTHRVSSYWSYMVIKPYRGFDENGIEFTLTYFDDPGVSLSYAITSWVAMRGFPDYLCKMREAGRQYKSYKMSKEDNTIVSGSEDRRDKDSQDDLEQPNIIEKNTDGVIDNGAQHKTDEKVNKETQSEPQSRQEDPEPEKSEISEPVGEETSGFLSYFFITRLFA